MHHSTAQKASISSQTMAPGSATPRWRAHSVQAHTPASSPKASSGPQANGPKARSSPAKAAHAASVPAVPGARGARPLPKPSAMTCAGWRSMKRHVARCVTVTS
jgi:hypothetical protein